MAVSYGRCDEVTRLVLLPSPLLGPAVWAATAGLLRAEGRPVIVATVPERVLTPCDVLAAWMAQLPEDEGLLLVPHSNAGLYVAAIADRRTVAGTVFVDAGLPEPPPGTPTAPAAFRDFLGGLVAADGLLPPWSWWWPESEAASLFPDAAARAAVRREERRLPLSYFEADVPSPGGWESRPAAYLGFGDAYGAEQGEARRRGWPVETLEGRHLHMMMDPPGVAAALLRLTGLLGLPE